MKDVVIAGALAVLMGAVVVYAQPGGKSGASGTATLATVTLPKKVTANGQPLAAGTYQVRLTNDEVKPAVGEAPNSERWVEFLKGGKVVGKELASVIPADEIKKLAESPMPKTNGARVDTLKGGNYLRVWINKGGENYLVNLPISS